MDTEDNKKPPAEDQTAAEDAQLFSIPHPTLVPLPENVSPEDELNYIKLVINLTSPPERHLTLLCYQANEVIPPLCDSLLEYMRRVIKRNPAAESEICEALKVEIPDDIEKEWGGPVAIMLLLLEKEEQTKIALAFEHPEKRDELTFFEKHLLDLLMETKRIQLEDQPDLPFQDLEASTPKEGGSEIIRLGAIVKARTVMRNVSLLERRFGIIPSGVGVDMLLKRGSKGSPEKTIKIYLKTPPGEDGRPQYITPCTRETLYAITTLKESGCDYMTPDQIYAEVYGMKTGSGSHISDKGVQDVINDIELARHTFCTISDETGENIVDDFLISVAGDKKMKKRTAKVTTKGFYVRDIDLLSVAAGKIGNRLPVDREVLSFEKAGLSNTRLGLTIRSYLLLEIHRIKNTDSKREEDSVITWDNMLRYEANPEIVEYLPSGEIKLVQQHGRNAPLLLPPIEVDPRGKKRATRKEIALKWLEYWKKVGFIFGYEIVLDPRDRRKEIGVIIHTDKSDKALAGLKKKDELHKYQQKAARAKRKYQRKAKG